MSYVNANELYEALEQCFEPDRYTELFPQIGLQYHNTDRIERIYTATFASIPVLRSILDKNTKNSLLFTHHPVPPKPNEDGNYGVIPQDLLEEMQDKKLTLFSYHIAMDCNNKYSPARTLAKALGMQPYAPFYPQNGGYIGVLCHTERTSTVTGISAALQRVLGHEVKVYGFGEDALTSKNVAVMPGGAKNRDIYAFLRQQNINVFITGVTNENISWVKETHDKAREYGVNILGGTHYSTEKFAPMAMAEFFDQFGLQTEFIPDLPNLADL
ncbi:MAG: Nif3-like dinuclear metal center hexameric protein [Candidatus Pelethousia sp.]|nr:Nif3-like dinuclear metal center hexameric protein [Candidatus Pelethousia sp.]